MQVRLHVYVCTVLLVYVIINEEGGGERSNEEDGWWMMGVAHYCDVVTHTAFVTLSSSYMIQGLYTPNIKEKLE